MPYTQPTAAMVRACAAQAAGAGEKKRGGGGGCGGSAPSSCNGSVGESGAHDSAELEAVATERERRRPVPVLQVAAAWGAGGRRRT